MNTSDRQRVRQDRAVRRAQIIDEGIRIIGQQGYNGFTVQGLAQRCGITNAGLLHYFGSKDQLLLALLDEIERREEEIVAPVLAVIDGDAQAGVNPKAAVIALMRKFADRTTHSREQTRFLATLQAESLNPAHPARRWFCAREVETINLLMKLVSPWASDPLLMARRLYAVFHGLILVWLRSDESFDFAGNLESAVQSCISC